MDAQSKEDDVPTGTSTTVHQEAQVPTPSAAREPCLDDKTLQEVAKRLGPDWVKLAVELGFKMVEVHTVEGNYIKDIERQGLEMLVAWKHAQSTSDEQQSTTLCTALTNMGKADIVGFLNGATVTGDVTTSSPNASPSSPSPSPIPSTQAPESPQVPISTNVNKNGIENISLTKALLKLLAVALQSSGRLITALGDFFTLCGVKLEHVTHGSVTFVVRILSREGLDKLWSMYTTGELARKLTEILITDELTTEDKSGLAIQVTILESDYEQACRFFDELEKDPQKEPCLDDKTLCEVATSLGCDWVTLAVELGSAMVTVETIKKNHPNNIQRQGLEMIVKWKLAQSTGVEQQMTTLCTALEKIERADIAGFLQGVPTPTPQLSQKPDQEPRKTDPCQEAVATVTGDVATSSPNANPSSPSPSPIPSTQASGTAASIGNIGTVSGIQIPTVVGAGQATFNYNLTPETAAATVTGDVTTSSPNANPSSPSPSPIPSTQASGVPAPRPQHSQRPDQEPRLGAPSYQDVGNKTRDILKEFYKTSGSYVQLLPGVDNDQMHIAGIYTKVQLETREGVADVTTGENVRKRGQKGEIVNSTEYDKIFRLRTRTGELITRLIFVGMGGVGKSTIFDRIAYDWADEVSEILKSFKLVFRLKMFALSQESDLVDSFDQLLDEDSGIAKDELDKFILANPNEVLILLDGFDEMMTKTLNADSFGSILKALNRTKYRKCVICVSTRPSHFDTLMSKSLVQNPCTHVEVLGFTDDSVNEYVRKFYDDNPVSGNALIQTIELSHVLHDFAKNPMLLMLMCSLWRENNGLPETLSRIFNRAVEHMFTRKDKNKKTAADAKTTMLDVSKELIAIGKTALRGLMRADQKFSFQEDEFEPNALHLALKVGILTQQSVIKNSKSHNNIQFMHKTIQQYCAAKYLQSLNKPGLLMLVRKAKFEFNLRQLCSTIEGVVSNEFLFRFCCGDNERCMTDVVNLLDQKFNKDEPRYQSDVVQVISQNCFFESQSEKAPQCLTSDSHISSAINVGNNNDLRNLVYLLEIIGRSADSRKTQLARVETIEVSCVSSVGDLALALGYMENLRNLRLHSCPLVEGDLEKILTSLKCNQLLTDLCIKGDSTLGGRAIEWAPHIKHLTSLNKLEISYCNLQITDMEHIALSVNNMPNLTDLILAGNTTLGGSADSWTQNLLRFTNIQTLNLRNCTLQWRDIEHIAWAVSDMPRLTDLILADNLALDVSTEKLSRYLLRVKQKHTLDLSNFSLTREDVDTICIVLDHIPALTNLILAGNPALSGSAKLWAKNLSRLTNIKTLNLSNCTMQWTDIENIASAVGDLPSLTDLILSDNPALDISTEKLSRYLLRVKQKHKLDLSNFSLTWEDVDTIVIVLDHIPALTNLSLAGNQALGKSADLWANYLVRFTNIKSLNLSSCTLEITAIKYIASAVGDMPRLTNLILAGNTALGGSAESWAKNFWGFTNIQTLNLSNCELWWIDIKHISLAVFYMPSLTDLILTDNSKLVVSTETLSRVLLRVKQKHTLDLSNFFLKWEDVDTISSALFHIPALTTLSLANHHELGGVAKLWAKSLPKLTNIKTLNLSNCTLQWTDIEHIASAAGGMPRLTALILADNTALGGSAELWAENFPQLAYIQTLNLSICSLQWTDIEHIVSAVGDMARLTNLILADNMALGGSAELWAKNFSQLAKIQMLNLSSCSLQWTDIEHIVSAVGNMPKLTDLILTNNPALYVSTESLSICWQKHTMT